MVEEKERIKTLLRLHRQKFSKEVIKTSDISINLNPSDFLIIDYLLSNLDNEIVIKRFSKNLTPVNVRKYIMADLYYSKNTDQDIHPFLEDSTLTNKSWTAYLSIIYEKDIQNFIYNLELGKKRFNYVASDEMLYRALSKYLNNDFEIYMEKISGKKGLKLLTICDELLTSDSIKSKKLIEEADKKLSLYKQLYKKYEINLEKRLKSLYDLQMVPELFY